MFANSRLPRAIAIAIAITIAIAMAFSMGTVAWPHGYYMGTGLPGTTMVSSMSPWTCPWGRPWKKPWGQPHGEGHGDSPMKKAKETPHGKGLVT